jgi:hypothetical protein
LDARRGNRRARVARLTALALCVAGVVAGCGATDKPDLERSAPLETADAQIAVRRDIDTALRRVKPNTPEHTVLILWKRANQRLSGVAAGAYDSRVIDALGFRAVQSGLDQQRSVFQAFSPRVTARESTPEGLVLSLTAVSRLPERKDTIREFATTYLLRRTAGRWAIVYDTVLEDGLAAYAKVAAAAPGADDEDKKKADAEAMAITERFRALSRDERGGRN